MTQLTLPPEAPTAAPQFAHHPTLEQLTIAPLPDSIAAFWAGEGAQSPIVTQHTAPTMHTPGLNSVTFLWRGNAAAVFVGLNRVTSTLEHAALINIDGTDLWHRSYLLPDTWRSSYTIMAADSEEHAVLAAAAPKWAMRMIREQGQADARNPLTVTAHAGIMSEIALPRATRNELIQQPVAPDTVTHTELSTPSGRRTWLIEPTTPAPPQGRPLIIMLDGEVWHSNGAAAKVIAALSAHSHSTGSPHTPAALLIEAAPGARVDNYGPESPFPAEIINEILPWIRTIAQISPHREDITLTGESLGGLTALRTAFAHPQHVQHIIAQSSSLWATDLVPQVPDHTAPQLNVHLTVGTYEHTMIAQHHALAAALQAEHHLTELIEFTGGHDMAWWVQLWANRVQHRFRNLLH